MRPKRLVIGALTLALSTGAVAETELGGNNISIVIPYRPGGGFDRAVRIFAPYFARQIGDDIRILPRNVPGAGGRRGATTVYRATPDGTTLGIFNLPGFVLPEILGEKVDYDLRELSWIGRLESQDYVLLVPSGSKLYSIEDLHGEREIAFLSTGYGSTVMAASQIAAHGLGLMYKDPIFLAGYTGTADYLVALMRGDGNVALAPVSSAATYIESGHLRPLATSGEDEDLDGVATFANLGLPELTALKVQRSIAGPPNMDLELLNRLRSAFNRAVSDPEFIAVARAARLDLRPLGGEQAAAEVAASFSYYERFRANLANPNVF
jgi:tripartite-type tricarboxylate transporter receptor subunit TctC